MNEHKIETLERLLDAFNAHDLDEQMSPLPHKPAPRAGYSSVHKRSIDPARKTAPRDR